MSVYKIVRPVWRKFSPQWIERAADHVKEGGHAAIIDAKGAIRVLLGVSERGQITELGLWSLLAIEQRRWRRVTDGPAKGLATARIKPAYEEAVLDWCARDAVHRGATRVIKLDCIKCAACCHAANVLLDDVDLGRFRDAGRNDLTRPAYIRRHKDGRIVLRFASDGRCQHLAGDNRCSIYEIRPDNCRRFVVGSEACLAAREDTLGIRDGAPIEWLAHDAPRS
jgi:uncharacterized protein